MQTVREALYHHMAHAIMLRSYSYTTKALIAIIPDIILIPVTAEGLMVTTFLRGSSSKRSR